MSQQRRAKKRPVRSGAYDRLQKLGREGRQQPNPGQIEPGAARRWRTFVVPLVRLFFRPSIEGADRLPATGPYLFVGNHSAMGNPDIGCLVACRLAPNTPLPPVAAMVHPVSFNSPLAGRWMAQLGAIPSTYEAAHAALAAGVTVLVFPGGDRDATRPIWRAYDVDFGGRKGFLRIARDGGVAIVPLAIRGSHFAAPILFRSKMLASLLVFPKRMGVRRLPVPLLGALGAAALWFALTPLIGPLLAAVAGLVFAISPVAQVPWIPWPVTIVIGDALAPAVLFPDDSDESLDAAYDRVRSTVEALLRNRPEP